MFQSLKIIVKKELKRIFSDKRLVFTNFILPMISIALMYSVMGMMIKSNFEESEAHTIKAIMHNTPPAFEEMLKKEGRYTLTEKTSDMAINDLLLSEEYDLYLEFDAEFNAKLEDYKSGVKPTITAHYSPKNEYLQEVKSSIQNAINEYKQNTLGERLGNQSYLEVFNFKMQEIDLPKEKKGIASAFVSLIPMLITIFIFAGAMGTGIDLFAGEKERGTMATMLVTPASRSAIIIGKMLSLAIVAFVSMMSSLIGVAISIPFSKTMFSGSAEIAPSSFAIAPMDILLIGICLLGLVAIFVSIISLVSMYAKNLKEAGTYISPIYMVVMLISFMSLFSGSSVKGYQLYVPVMNNIANMKMILSGDGNLLNVFISLLTSIVVAGVLVLLTKNMIYKEKVVFPE